MRFGPYEIVSELGRGAQGSVYQARDSRSRRLVALKHFPHGRSYTKRRFETEVKALSRLEHPSLPKVLDWGWSSRGAWFVQELIDAKSLRDRLRRWGKLPVDEALRVTAELARALDHVHAAGVLHRDVKPDNVLLRSDGRPVLVDFGLALDLESEHSRLTQSGQCLGSPGYWAPELAMGKLDEVGPAADLYGLGATLYELLSGHPPVQGQSLADYCDPERFRAVTPLPDKNTQVTAKLWEVIGRCLHLEPAQRFASGSELAAALEALRGETSEPPKPRGSVAPALVPALALAFLGGGLVVHLFGSSAPAKSPSPGVGSSKPASAVDTQRVDQLLERFAEAFAREDLERASALLDEADALSPDDWRVWLRRAVIHDYLGDAQSARVALERADSINPKSAKVLGNLGLSCMRSKELDAALAYFQRAHELAPGDPGILLRLGEILFDLGQFAEAQRFLNRVIVLREATPQAWELRGKARVKLGDEEGAYEDYKEAVKLAPKVARLHAMVAQLAASLKDLEAAHAAATRSLELVPENPLMLDLRVRTAANLKRPAEEILKDVTALLALNPDNIQALRWRAHEFMKAERWAEAIPDLNRLATLTPDDRDVYARRGLALMMTRKLKLARLDYERVVRRDDATASDHASYAAVLIGLREFKASRAPLRRALEIDPDNFFAHLNRGTLELEVGNVEESIQHLERAHTRKPKHLGCLNTLVFAHRKLGNLDTSEGYLAKVLALQPDLPQAKRERCLLLSARGKHPQARELGERLAREAPKDAKVWLMLGEVCLNAGELPRAREACNRGLELVEHEGTRLVLEDLKQQIEGR